MAPPGPAAQVSGFQGNGSVAWAHCAMFCQLTAVKKTDTSALTHRRRGDGPFGRQVGCADRQSAGHIRRRHTARVHGIIACAARTFKTFKVWSTFCSGVASASVSSACHLDGLRAPQGLRTARLLFQIMMANSAGAQACSPGASGINALTFSLEKWSSYEMQLQCRRGTSRLPIAVQ